MRGNLKASYIDEGKLGYTYSMKNFSVTSSLACLSMENADDMLRWNIAGYVHNGMLTLNAGVNLYN